MDSSLTNRLMLYLISYLFLTTIKIEAKQAERRRKDKPTTSASATPNNICDITDRDSKVHCYCENSQVIKSATKAECWVFNGGIPHDDPIWPSFASQPNLQVLSFNVRADGGLNFVPTKSLKYLRRLTSLNVKYASINELPSFAFANLSSVSEITLSRNKIVILRQSAFCHLSNLSVLTLDDNRIDEIQRHVFHDLPILQKLYLTNNNITILHDGAFKHLTNLIELGIDKNSLSVLTKESFDGLANLKRLDLRDNRMTMLGDFTFAELWNLQELLLDKNELQLISERAFDGLSQLKRLSLSDNKLVSLVNGLFEGVRGLNSLDLRSNNLHALTIESIRPIFDNLKNGTSYFNIAENEFVCDCRLIWMHQLRNDTKSDKIKSSLEDVTCVIDPLLLESLLAKALPQSQQVSGRKTPSEHGQAEQKNNQVDRQLSDQEYEENPEGIYDDRLEDDEYDTAQQDSANGHALKEGIISEAKGKTDTIHLFQIPLEMLPCPQNLNNPTEAPYSPPTQGEVKDLRNENAAIVMRSSLAFVGLMYCMRCALACMA